MRSKRYQKIIFVSIPLVVILLALIISCGNPRMTKEEVISKTQTAMEGVQTYAVELSVNIIQGGIYRKSSAHIVYLAPDRLHIMPFSADGTMEIIRIGDTEYNRQPGTKRWEVRKWSDTFTPFDMTTALSEIIGFLSAINELVDDEIDGVCCYHYQGNIDMNARAEFEKSRLDPSSPDYDTNLKVLDSTLYETKVELWIDKNNFFLRRLIYHQEIRNIVEVDLENTSTNSASIEATYRFFDFNQPFEIKPPTLD